MTPQELQFWEYKEQIEKEALDKYPDEYINNVNIGSLKRWAYGDGRKFEREIANREIEELKQPNPNMNHL